MQLPDRFEPLPRGPAQTGRRTAIERHSLQPFEDQPNAGTDVLSSRQQPAMVGPRSVFIQNYAEVKDIAVKTS
jgi:hypothetical protein